MRKNRAPGFGKTAAVLALAGVLLTWLTYRGARGITLAADALFCEATVFLVWGVFHRLGNVRMFASLTWGFHCVHRLLRREERRSEEMKEDYLAYRASRPRHDDVAASLALAAVLGGLSLLLSCLAARHG